MRLFSRRKEFQFDDPRLVGMSPLKTIDESFNNSRPGGVDGETAAAADVSDDLVDEIAKKGETILIASSSSSPIQIPGVSNLEDRGSDDEMMSLMMTQRLGSSKSSSNLHSIPSSSPPSRNSNTVLMFLPTLQQQESPRNKWLSQSSACLVSATAENKKGNVKSKANLKSGANQQQNTQRDQNYESPSSPAQGSNGLGSLSTWGKRVSVTWDQMRRSESSETLTSGILSSTLNRRKTLHFYPDMEYSSSNSSSTSKLSEKVLAAKEKFSTLRRESKIAQKGEGKEERASGKKIGRVESLRILLTKSNRKTKGKVGVDTQAGGIKVDKGTDTVDLPGSESLDLSRLSDELMEDPEMMFLGGGNPSVLRNYLYNSTGQLQYLGGGATSSDTTSSRRCSVSSSASPGSSQSLKDAFLMMKTTSCENLSTLNRHHYGRYLANSGQLPPPPPSPSSTPGGGSNGTKTTSTGTMTGGGSVDSSTSTNNTTANAAKRSSFPYAYIRSKLTALPEEPNHNQASTSNSTSGGNPSSTSGGNPKPTSEKDHKSLEISARGSKPRRSLSQRGFFHSMGDLLSRSSSASNSTKELNVDDDEDYPENSLPSSSSILLRKNSKRRGSTVPARPNSIDCPPGHRMFDPLTQIRIDLLHKNPSDFESDACSSSPQLWGRRSYSIGDILSESSSTSKMMGSSTNVEESGYDSDSTRTGHESPRSSMKIGGSETEREPSTSSSSSASTSSNTSNQNDVDFDVDSSIAAPSPVQSQSCSSDDDTPPKSYGPLAYVTLSRTQKDGPHRNIKASNSSSTFVANTARTLPRSQSISSGVKPQMRRKASCVEISTSSSPFISRTQVLIGGEVDKQLSAPVSAAPSLRLRNKVRDRDSWNATRQTRSQSLCLSIFSVKFEKGPTKKSLGFSVVGGKDSPKGSMGIFIKRIFPYGQASEEGNITEGDEILSVNGHSLSNSTHTEALNIFKGIKSGEVVLQIARREMVKPTPTSQPDENRRSSIPARSNSYLRSKSISCEQLSERKI